jgi:hypothetical protein
LHRSLIADNDQPAAVFSLHELQFVLADPFKGDASMKSTILWALVVLNAVLLAAFLSRVTRPNTANAQAAANTRRPGDYLMISGEVVGGPSGVVYVVDTTNGLLGGMTYDDTRHQIDVMPVIDINQAFQQNQPKPAGKAK